jgi:protein SMG8
MDFRVLDLYYFESCTPQGYLSVWADMRYRYARALMFLFNVSHILIISHPTHIFDINYVHLFRALDVMR